jgi:hypothetical protein
MKRLLLSYAQDLNDAYPGHEFSIWSEEQLLGFFNEALCLIAAHRPDMFTELKVVRVEPCSNYLDLCDCEKVLDVLGQSNAKGNNIRPIQRRKERATVWTGSKKKQEFTDRITEYELLDKSNLVRVFPQNLDPTKDIYVVVRCSISPKTYALDDEAPDERCAFLAAARHWVLYNAKMIDGEFSQTMQSQAKEHREMFTAILQMVKQADDQYDEKLRGLTIRQR